MTQFLYASDKQAILEAIGAMEVAMKKGDYAAAEKAMKQAESVVGSVIPQTENQLKAKRTERLYAEEWETLTPQEKQIFDRLYGERGTLRRLATAAQQQADRLWAARETAQQAKEYEQGMWQGHPSRDQLPGADYDKLLEQSERLEAKRAERLKARAARELAAEAHNEEQARIMASLDAEEHAIFEELVTSLPSQLDRLRAFKQAMAGNPLDGIDDPATLYKLAEERAAEADPATQRKAQPAPDVTGIYDVNQLYDIALNQILEER